MTTFVQPPMPLEHDQNVVIAILTVVLVPTDGLAETETTKTDLGNDNLHFSFPETHPVPDI